jgi:folate-binding Fe-S cluster repair protein YgfZ
MQAGQCRYSLMCNEQGGVKDDVIVYRMDDTDFLVVVNASNREKILTHVESVRAKNDWIVKIDDQTTSTAMVAIQGPKVMELVSKFSKEIPSLKRYRFTVKNLLIMKLVVSRTGYTGEDGVEVILPSSAVGMALGMLLKDAGMPASARAIRFEWKPACRSTGMNSAKISTRSPAVSISRSRSTRPRKARRRRSSVRPRSRRPRPRAARSESSPASFWKASARLARAWA